jgi:crotonobetainyl-CoA:carnitine CoA-transferase CaiB-like acyl-CoA transferase
MINKMTMKNKGALSGIKVLDLTRILPGPYCSMMLADHGAHVIALEDKRFIADDMYATPLYRNKEHISLNLKSREGKEVFSRLVRDVDILMEGFRPGVVKKIGVDYESVREINPGLIYCSITGFGQHGEFKDRAGHDVNYLSYAGVMDLIGEKGHPPVIPGIQIADMASGSMSAMIGILLALQARHQTGKGQYIDISMTDCSVGFLQFATWLQKRTGMPLKRGDGILSHRYACYNIYETKDNRYISIGAVENRFWKQLCEFLGVPDLAQLQYDDTRRQEIIDFMRNTFKEKSLDQWCKTLKDLDACWAPVQSLDEVLQDPYFREREVVVDIKDKNENKTTAIGVPIKLSDTPGSIRTSPVDFGESTMTVLKRLGYSEEKIMELEEKGVI